MINIKAVTRIVKSKLPHAEQAIVDKIVAYVIQDAEIIIHSMIRQAVAQERDKLYQQKNN